MITQKTRFAKRFFITAAVLLFSAYSSIAANILIFETDANKTKNVKLSDLKDPGYSGDLVNVNDPSGDRYPGPDENIYVYGANGYKDNAILSVDISATIGNLTLGSGSNDLGVVNIYDDVTFIVDTLNAIDPNFNGANNKINYVNANNTSTSGVLYYSYLQNSYFNTTSAPVYPISALPVEFISFTVAKHNSETAVLNFSTAWEINNAGFDVERSTNGISWNKIGFVQGNGNTTEIKNYAFETSLTNINSAVVYYRLKQVDFNGQSEYSATRTLRLNATAAKSTSVYPNPATSRISVSLEGVAAGETANISVMDMSGRILISANQVVEEGNYALDMNIEQLTKGNYIVSISSPSSHFNTKLVKF